MKRVGHLYDHIAEYDNLMGAFHAAAKGKHRKQEVRVFRRNLDTEICVLREEFLAENVSLGDYHYFTIHDPKERCICAASFRERVIHHAIVNIVGPTLERPLIDQSFACRKDKGQYRAALAAQTYARKSPFFLKMDIRKYFDSINHLILNDQLTRLFKENALLRLYQRVLSTYCIQPYRGLPIGNLTSQYFANLYLSPLDHFVKQTLRCRYYVRYMDDFMLWGTQQQVRQWQKQTITFLKEHLALNARGTGWINHTSHGCDFLGFRVFPHALRLSSRSKRRFRTKLHDLELGLQRGVIGEEAYQQRMTALCAFAAQADSEAYRRKLISDVCYDG